LAEEKSLRFKALRQVILTGGFDIVLLQEVWIGNDYNFLRYFIVLSILKMTFVFIGQQKKIRTAMPYHHHFQTGHGCSNLLIPLGCSGDYTETVIGKLCDLGILLDFFQVWLFSVDTQFLKQSFGHLEVKEICLIWMEKFWSQKE